MVGSIAFVNYQYETAVGLMKTRKDDLFNAIAVHKPYTEQLDALKRFKHVNV